MALLRYGRLLLRPCFSLFPHEQKHARGSVTVNFSAFPLAAAIDRFELAVRDHEATDVGYGHFGASDVGLLERALVGRRAGCLELRAGTLRGRGAGLGREGCES